MTAEEKGIWSCQNKESWQLKKRTCTCTCLKYRQINRNSILLVTAVIWILVLITISVRNDSYGIEVELFNIQPQTTGLCLLS